MMTSSVPCYRNKGHMTHDARASFLSLLAEFPGGEVAAIEQFSHDDS